MSDVFWGWRVDAGPEPTYVGKMRVSPPLGAVHGLNLSNVIFQLYHIVIEKSENVQIYKCPHGSR